jgi:3-hydroxyisobutyrate dehydrogenase
MSAESDEVVGVIGLGSIGGHVARTVARTRRVVAFDVRAEAYTQFPEPEVADSPRAVAEAADVVLVAVYNDEQLRETLTGADGLLASALKPSAICVLSTVTLETLRWAAERSAEAGVELLDCGVTGGSGLRAHGKIVVLAGGSDEGMARARATLELFAAPLLHMGGLGAGMQAKLARNLMHYSGWYASWEAARVAEAAGVDVAKLVEAHRVSNEWSGGGTSLLSRGIGPGPADPEDEASLAARRSSADYARKDLGYVLELAAEYGLALPGAELVRERIDLVVGLAGVPTEEPA